jgi:hypothetical protein
MERMLDSGGIGWCRQHQSFHNDPPEDFYGSHEAVHNKPVFRIQSLKD